MINISRLSTLGVCPYSAKVKLFILGLEYLLSLLYYLKQKYLTSLFQKPFISSVSTLQICPFDHLYVTPSQRKMFIS